MQTPMLSRRPLLRRAHRGWAAVLRTASLLALLTGLFLAWASLPAGAQTEPESQFKSVFVDEAGFGKDPFFPRSKRRQVQPTVQTNLVVAPVEGVELKGLSGTKKKRLAIINNYTFAAGEEHTLKINKQPILVRCLEIRDDSVVVDVGGFTRELHLPAGHK